VIVSLAAIGWVELERHPGLLVRLGIIAANRYGDFNAGAVSPGEANRAKGLLVGIQSRHHGIVIGLLGV
jgi:hypothetical protein